MTWNLPKTLALALVAALLIAPLQVAPTVGGATCAATTGADATESYNGNEGERNASPLSDEEI